MDKQKLLKLIGLDGTIAVACIACYSPGLLALRPTDLSIFRAGSSIFVGIVLAAAFLLGNVRILNGPRVERVRADGSNTTDIEAVKKVLQTYVRGWNFGGLAKTALEQANRLEKSSARAKMVIEDRFGNGNISSARYMSVVEAAVDMLYRSLTRIAARMQVFDEEEYERLRHYREDDIPDDVQERQIALYQKNLNLIKDAIRANEEVLLHLDELAMELSIGQEDNTDDLLTQIEQLTGEVKYYI